MIREAINKVVNHIDLEEGEMSRVMEGIMGGEATPAQIAAFITGLRMKGETINEIVGATRVMREKATKIPLNGKGENNDRDEKRSVLIDTCGTGGDDMKTFNISTVTAFVVAAGGVKVAKHGNRSVSSRCGSADVLERLGVAIDASPDAVARHIEEVGIGFLFAPAFHGSMKHAIGPRREIGVRTIFNVLGPLTNPTSARYQLLGVYRDEYCEMLAGVLLRLGTRRAMVVHGLDGMDEISVTTDTKVAEVRDGAVSHYFVNPRDFGFEQYSVEDLRGGDAGENAAILRRVLSGAEKGAKRAVVLMNAGAAFYIAGIGKDLKEGIRYAEETVDTGRAIKKLEEFIGASRA